MSKDLKLDDGITYKFEKAAVYAPNGPEGKKYYFTSISKVKEFKDKQGDVHHKWQTLTCKPEHLASFIAFLEECIAEMKAGKKTNNDPF